MRGNCDFGCAIVDITLGLRDGKRYVLNSSLCVMLNVSQLNL